MRRHADVSTLLRLGKGMKAGREGPHFLRLCRVRLRCLRCLCFLIFLRRHLTTLPTYCLPSLAEKKTL